MTTKISVYPNARMIKFSVEVRLTTKPDAKLEKINVYQKEKAPIKIYVQANAQRNATGLNK